MNSFRLTIFLGIVLVFFIFYQQLHVTTHTPPKSVQIVKPTAQLTTASDSVLITLVYPKATVTSQSENIITLESNDSPAQIISWYKENIRHRNYPSQTFIQSNTNAIITAKITTTNNTHALSVTIEKTPEEKVTQITIIAKKPY